MDQNSHPIAREGYPFVALGAFVTLIFALLDWSLITLVGLVLTLFTIYFFRDPRREPPPGEDLVVAPADGKIVFVGEVDEERFLHQRMTKVSIFMSVFDVHVNRAPCSGQVVDMYYQHGDFVNASYDKASDSNEQAGILLESEQGHRLLFVQIAGLIARRIVTYPLIGDHLERGARYGIIRFGSRLDVYLPRECAVSVTLGEKVIAGETVLGTWT